MQYQYTVKYSFPYKNKMLIIKASGAIKSIMKKIVKQIKFQNKNNEQNNFFQYYNKILLIKEKTLLKKTNPIKVLFAQSARTGCGFPQPYCSFEFLQTFQFFHLIWYKFPKFRAKKFTTLCTTKNCSYQRNVKLGPLVLSCKVCRF